MKLIKNKLIVTHLPNISADIISFTCNYYIDLLIVVFTSHFTTESITF